MKKALKPYMEKKITNEQALKAAVGPIRKFMVKQTREKDIALLMDIAGKKGQRILTMCLLLY